MHAMYVPPPKSADIRMMQAGQVVKAQRPQLKDTMGQRSMVERLEQQQQAQPHRQAAPVKHKKKHAVLHCTWHVPKKYRHLLPYTPHKSSCYRTCTHTHTHTPHKKQPGLLRCLPNAQPLKLPSVKMKKAAQYSSVVHVVHIAVVHAPLASTGAG